SVAVDVARRGDREPDVVVRSVAIKSKAGRSVEQMQLRLAVRHAIGQVEGREIVGSAINDVNSAGRRKSVAIAARRADQEVRVPIAVQIAGGRDGASGEISVGEAAQA